MGQKVERLFWSDTHDCDWFLRDPVMTLGALLWLMDEVGQFTALGVD